MPDSVNAAALETLRARLGGKRHAPRATAATRRHCARTTASAGWPRATGHCNGRRDYRFVSDDPAKVTMEKRDAARAVVGAAIVPMISRRATLAAGDFAVLRARQAGYRRA